MQIVTRVRQGNLSKNRTRDFSEIGWHNQEVTQGHVCVYNGVAKHVDQTNYI